MCVFFLALQPSSRYVLVAANNRDEFFARNTAHAAFWEDHPSILAGRDIDRGGTWMGVSRDGKMAALTNIRAPYHEKRTSTARSRGQLVSDFLQSGCIQSPMEYCQSVLSQTELYNGFNLITTTLNPTLEAVYCSNADPGIVRSLKPGVYGVSNQLLDSPWKKVTRGKQRFVRLVADLQDGAVDLTKCEQQLLDLLCDDTCLYPDETVPTMGFPESILRHLNSVFVSPVCLSTGQYGTRTNTVVTVSASGDVTFTERTRVCPVDLLQKPQWDTNRFTFHVDLHPASPHFS